MDDASDRTQMLDSMGPHNRRPVQKWTPIEKDMFLKHFKVYGKNWSVLTQLIPNKTESQIKNYYQNYKNRLGLHDMHTIRPPNHGSGAASDVGMVWPVSIEERARNRQRHNQSMASPESISRQGRSSSDDGGSHQDSRVVHQHRHEGANVGNPDNHYDHRSQPHRHEMDMAGYQNTDGGEIMYGGHRAGESMISPGSHHGQHGGSHASALQHLGNPNVFNSSLLADPMRQPGFSAAGGSSTSSGVNGGIGGGLGSLMASGGLLNGNPLQLSHLLPSDWMNELAHQSSLALSTAPSQTVQSMPLMSVQSNAQMLGGLAAPMNQRINPYPLHNMAPNLFEPLHAMAHHSTPNVSSAQLNSSSTRQAQTQQDSSPRQRMSEMEPVDRAGQPVDHGGGGGGSHGGSSMGNSMSAVEDCSMGEDEAEGHRPSVQSGHQSKHDSSHQMVHHSARLLGLNYTGSEALHGHSQGSTVMLGSMPSHVSHSHGMSHVTSHTGSHGPVHAQYAAAAAAAGHGLAPGHGLPSSIHSIPSSHSRGGEDVDQVEQQQQQHPYENQRRNQQKPEGGGRQRYNSDGSMSNDGSVGGLAGILRAHAGMLPPLAPSLATSINGLGKQMMPQHANYIHRLPLDSASDNGQGHAALGAMRQSQGLIQQTSHSSQQQGQAQDMNPGQFMMDPSLVTRSMQRGDTTEQRPWPPSGSRSGW
uniref:SANT domain-containing protein n=1 Tax=Octactis speculum TaxID=3111310 RepID=A0A7S2AHH8_9STRA|mmetsp:Transcript_10014/g.13077  ORF Transcript_10014/g.13077 Transcript_10014/m.13077 type:complete len:698 (+) Transcript_10014:96-2189(+)